MEQDRFVIIDNQKGVVIPLQSEKGIAIERIKDNKLGKTNDSEIEEKVSKIQMLIKAFVKQSIKETIKEYNLQLTEELKEYEKAESARWEKLEQNELARWEKLEQADLKRWEILEEKNEKYWKQTEEYFKALDNSIREKQEEGKRKKHSIF